MATRPKIQPGLNKKPQASLARGRALVDSPSEYCEAELVLLLAQCPSTCWEATAFMACALSGINAFEMLPRQS